MARKVKAAQLRQQVAAIEAGADEDGVLPDEPAVELTERGREAIDAPAAPAEPFGAWLLRQKRREDWVGQLATQAAADRAFTRTSTAEDLSKRFNALGADGEAHEMLERAELEWLAL